jgi:Beta-lactamase enzyme family
MAAPARSGRPARFTRVRRTVSALAAFVVLVALAVAGTPGGASEDPTTVPEAAPAAEPSQTPTPSPSAVAATEPLAAPVATTSKPKPRPVDRYRAVQVVAERVTAQADGFASFTLLDRLTGRRIGDPRATQVTFIESTIKAWLAADLLATRAAAGARLSSYETARMTAMIRLSDDNAAQVIWRWLGADRSITDMIRICHLQDTKVYPGWWSKTEISARDLARLGDCITPGKNKFLSPTAGAPLLALMRSVDPTNAFGIQQVHPAGAGVRVAVKNGWTEHGSADGTVWNVNCLGIWGAGNRWVLAVITRYPAANGLDYGAGLCRQVTSAVLPLTRPTEPSK